MRKLSKVLAAVMCTALIFACTAPTGAGAEGRRESKTASLDVMLVVDDTVSMQRNDPNHIASLALQKFADKIPGEGSRIGMATYDDDIMTSQPMMRVYTQEDKETLKKYAETGLTQDGRFTDLPSALAYAVKQIRSLEEMDSIPAIIAVSDGENDFMNTDARTRSDKNLEMVLEAGIPVYLIVINASDTPGVREYMEGIAAETGGEALFVESGDEIDLFLTDVANRLYGYVVDPNQRFNDQVGVQPVEWVFSLTEGIFEANLELSHMSGLELELTGPDGKPLSLEGDESVTVSSISDRDGEKTTIRLIEPDAGDYSVKLSSPARTQYVVIEIILNNEIYVQVELTPDSAKEGEPVQVTAKLMRGEEQYTDLEFANLEAEVSLGDQPPKTMSRDDSTNAFQEELTAPDQTGDYQVVVTVQGQKSFHRSSDPVTLTVEKVNAGTVNPGNYNTGTNKVVNPGEKDIPLWIIILAVVLLVMVILVVIGLMRRKAGPGGQSGSKYICLQGTLTVAYMDDTHHHIWEKYVQPSRYYTKRKPRESLGKMLRDQQDYGEVPDFFDGIQIAGVQYGDGRLCVEVSGELATPSGPEKINQFIDIANGRETDEFYSYDDMSPMIIRFADGTQAELSFSLV